MSFRKLSNPFILSSALMVLVLLMSFQHCAPPPQVEELNSASLSNTIEVIIPNSQLMAKNNLINTCAKTNHTEIYINYDKSAQPLCSDLSFLDPKLPLGEICPGGAEIMPFDANAAYVSCKVATLCGVAPSNASEFLNSEGQKSIKLEYDDLPWGCNAKLEIINPANDDKVFAHQYVAPPPCRQCDLNVSTCFACANRCLKPWANIEMLSGDSVVAFKSSIAPFGTTCLSEKRVCEDGVLSGSFLKETCRVGDPDKCVAPWEEEIAHNTSVKIFNTAVTSATAPNCTSITAKCLNGSFDKTLDGFSTKSCKDVTPAPISLAYPDQEPDKIIVTGTINIASLGTGVAVKLECDNCESISKDDGVTWVGKSVLGIQNNMKVKIKLKSLGFGLSKKVTLKTDGSVWTSITVATRTEKLCNLTTTSTVKPGTATYYNFPIATLEQAKQKCTGISRTCADGVLSGDPAFIHKSCNQETINCQFGSLTDNDFKTLFNAYAGQDCYATTDTKKQNLFKMLHCAFAIGGFKEVDRGSGSTTVVSDAALGQKTFKIGNKSCELLSAVHGDNTGTTSYVPTGWELAGVTYRDSWYIRIKCDGVEYQKGWYSGHQDYDGPTNNFKDATNNVKSCIIGY